MKRSKLLSFYIYIIKQKKEKKSQIQKNMHIQMIFNWKLYLKLRIFNGFYNSFEERLKFNLSPSFAG